jgi:hypothetical protein
MEIINDGGLEIFKGDNYVVVKVVKPKHLQAGYSFIDGILGKGYTLISVEQIGLGANIIGFTAHLAKK